MNVNQYQYPQNIYPNYPINPQPKKSKIWLYILIPVIIFIALLFIVLFVYGLIFFITKLKSTEKYLDGAWNCVNNQAIAFDVDDKTFEMYSLNSSINARIIGKYKVQEYNVKLENGNNYFEYNSNLTIQKTINNEIVDDQEFSKNYKITIYGDNQSKMDLYDVENNVTYNCQKAD